MQHLVLGEKPNWWKIVALRSSGEQASAVGSRLHRQSRHRRCRPEAAAGHQGGHRAGPVIAAGGPVDAWGAAEFARAIDNRLLEQAPLVQIGQQRREAPIQLRQERGAQPREVVRVRVPVADSRR